MIEEYLVIGAAVVIGVLGTARVTKLLTEDTWPPAAWWRNRWVGWFQTSDWAELATCPFCMSVWVALPNLLVAYFSDLHPVWWLFNAWLGLAYVAAIIVARDIPVDKR